MESATAPEIVNNTSYCQPEAVTRDQMADVIKNEVESAFQTLVSVTALSGNLKKELKGRILETVSILRNKFVKMENDLITKTAENSILVNEVKKLKGELQNVKDKGQVPQSFGTRLNGELDHNQIMVSRDRERKLYSEVTNNRNNVKRYKLMLKSKGNQSGDDMKNVIRTSINPTALKVGICAMKSLRDGRVMIETNSKEEIDILKTAIDEKCCQLLDVNVPKLWNPNLVIYHIPEEVTIENAENIIISQNPEINLQSGDLKCKFIFKNKKNLRNLVVEVTSQVRKKILNTKLKIGWLICHVDDYIRVNRCFKCSRFNHRAKECRGEVTCPRCSAPHNLAECRASTSELNCINCISFNNYNQQNPVNINHSSLDKNCPSLIAVIRKFKQNIDY